MGNWGDFLLIYESAYESWVSHPTLWGPPFFWLIAQSQDPKIDYSVSLEHPSYMDMTPTSLFFGFWLGYFFIGGIIVGLFIWLEKHRRYQQLIADDTNIAFEVPE